jgi:hypothetical protein
LDLLDSTFGFLCRKLNFYPKKRKIKEYLLDVERESGTYLNEVGELEVN